MERGEIGDKARRTQVHAGLNDTVSRVNLNQSSTTVFCFLKHKKGSFYNYKNIFIFSKINIKNICFNNKIRLMQNQ